MIRIAWFDKINKKYDYGNWHDEDTLHDKHIWVTTQNDKYNCTHYWVETNEGPVDYEYIMID
tara:strand:- start:6283 stop:6468 length:186 start_codon:yes stop_codon:yes gene_type:complete